jgi:hypothetical protein
MKYKNKWTICNQMHKHASQKEAHRCDELTILERQGYIKDLLQQPIFNLLHGFLWHKEKMRGIDYVADFSYYDNQKKCFVVEDTKGYKTDLYVMKKKLLLNIMKTREDFVFLES